MHSQDPHTAAPPVTAPHLRRLEVAGDDTAWMPAGVRASGAAAGLVFFVVALLALGALFVLLFFEGWLWYGVLFVGLTPAVVRFRDRIAKSAMRRRMQTVRLRALALPAGEPGAAPRDGELVRVRGRVRALTTLPALLDDTRGVYRRLVFSLHGVEAIHEAAVDFLVEEEGARPVLVRVSGARFIGQVDPRAALKELPRELLETLADLEPPPALSGALADWRIDAARGTPRPVTGAEGVLREGDLVEVVGSRGQIVDPTVAERLPRETPMRATLEGTATMPLLLTRAEP